MHCLWICHPFIDQCDSRWRNLFRLSPFSAGSHQECQTMHKQQTNRCNLFTSWFRSIKAPVAQVWRCSSICALNQCLNQTWYSMSTILHIMSRVQLLWMLSVHEKGIPVICSVSTTGLADCHICQSNHFFAIHSITAYHLAFLAFVLSPQNALWISMKWLCIVLSPTETISSDSILV